jgi:hypothetical protein
MTWERIRANSTPATTKLQFGSGGTRHLHELIEPVCGRPETFLMRPTTALENFS